MKQLKDDMEILRNKKRFIFPCVISLLLSFGCASQPLKVQIPEGKEYFTLTSVSQEETLIKSEGNIFIEYQTNTPLEDRSMLKLVVVFQIFKGIWTYYRPVEDISPNQIQASIFNPMCDLPFEKYGGLNLEGKVFIYLFDSRTGAKERVSNVLSGKAYLENIIPSVAILTSTMKLYNVD